MVVREERHFFGLCVWVLVFEEIVFWYCVFERINCMVFYRDIRDNSSNIASIFF